MCERSVPGLNASPASMRDLARRLLVLEAGQATKGKDTHESVRVLEKLRDSLGRFAGPEGFASLFRRALVLARADIPSIPNLRIGADGAIEGFEQLVTGADDGDAAVAVTAHLLGLLTTFVGEQLTLRLVRDVWPDAALDQQQKQAISK